MIGHISYLWDREYVFKPLLFNLLIGRSGSGKTLFLKSLFASICHSRTGVPMEEVEAQMVFDSSVSMSLEFNESFQGTVFYVPSTEVYVDIADYVSLPLHIRKTVGVYRSWQRQGFDFDKVLKDEIGVSSLFGGLLKAKLFLAVVKEIKPGDILLVDLPEAGVDALVWKWWIDKIESLTANGIQVFLTTHDFFVYTYIRSKFTSGEIFYFDEGEITPFDISHGIPDDAPILRVPLEVLESAM